MIYKITRTYMSFQFVQIFIQIEHKFCNICFCNIDILDLN